MIRLQSLMRVPVVLLAVFCVEQASAVDPPYQGEMQRLLEVMGSLYFLEPLCGTTTADWRAEAADLVSRDAPDPDREQRLYGAFNQGYEAYARLYRHCTLAAHEAMMRLFDEAETGAKDIHSRFAE
jgi:uncharacterized protein (TIGR02301 family)